MPLGISVLGRRRRVTTREPGDLPSAVVTREDVGRGVQTLASPALPGATAGLGSRRRPTDLIPRSKPCLPPPQPPSGIARSFLPPLFSLSTQRSRAHKMLHPTN